MYLEGPHKKFDLVIDNASVKKLHGKCDDDLIRNGNFGSDAKFWSRMEGAYIAIDNKSIRVTNRLSSSDGINQNLYIDKECFEPRFYVCGKSF